MQDAPANNVMAGFSLGGYMTIVFDFTSFWIGYGAGFCTIIILFAMAIVKDG
jgi:hypothetical protein